MKSSRLAIALSLIGASLVAQEDPAHYTSFIRQYQQTSGIDWHMPVELQGEALSPLTIEEDGALFQLWAVNNLTYRDYLIDQKLVGAYLPRGEITIITLDPFEGVPRTRADQPFQVHFEVSGLLSGPNLPEAATKVLIEQFAAHYPESQTLTRDEALAGDPVRSDFLEENGITPYEIASTSLTGPDPTKVSGEEHFLMHALPDGNLVQTQIASARVQIFPVTSGKIAGVQNGDVVRTLPPTLTVTLKDLYPSSATYLQIYPGTPTLGTAGKKISGSILVLDQDKSQDRTLSIRNWVKTMEQEGVYTIELLTETPFGTERLDHVSFTFDRTLKIRAMITSIE